MEQRSEAKHETPGTAASLIEQGRAVVGRVGDAALHAMRHAEAIGSLLRLELKDYARRQKRVLVCLVIGGVLLLCAYMLVCALGILLLHRYLDLRLTWAVSAVVVFNILVGMLVLLIGLCGRPTGPAPDTLCELKKDLECVKIYLKKNKKF